MKSQKWPKRRCPKGTCKLGILCFCAPWLPEISRDYTANLLLTGSKDESTLNFYKNAGYNCADKTAFIQWIK